ncbi:MAG: orotidine-5'-phosphate decarboxylase [Planctomycetota bacterium]|nr:orotidine-5'-phosphate decarboxylase [Planctomycetota bacterium]
MSRIETLAAPVCVGLDPVVDRLPDCLRDGSEPIAAILDFSLGVLEAVAGHTPCVKLQSACYERYGPAGIQVLFECITKAEQLDLEVILDFKRGDIGISAQHYAEAAYRDTSTQPSWVTASPYLGADGFDPFVRPDRGAFVLVRTSNPSGDAIQEMKLEGGGTVAEAVGAYVAKAGEASVGARGYSAIGAVVGATKPEAAARLREIMPDQLFLVPGFGAQGGGADDVKPCFKSDGTGALVTASRSVIYAFDSRDDDWQGKISEAAKKLADQVGVIAGLR